MIAINTIITNVICSINLVTCIEATRPTNVFNASLIIDKEKTYIVRTKRENYSSSLINKFLKLNNNTLDFQDVNDINNFFKIKLPYSASVRDIIHISEGKLLAVGSLFPAIYEIDIKTKTVKKLPFELNEFEYMNGVKVGNEIYITGFRINNKTGKPNSNGNIYKITTCEEKNRYCIDKIRSIKVNLYRSIGIICNKYNNCIPAVRDSYDSSLNIKTIGPKGDKNISCQNISYSKDQFRRSLIPKECTKDIRFKNIGSYDFISKNNFKFNIGNEDQGPNMNGKIYLSKKNEQYYILDIKNNIILIKEVSTNNIYIINKNKIELLEKKLNKKLQRTREVKSEVYHIAGYKNKFYATNTLVNNMIFSFDMKEGKGNWIRLEALSNQENGQPQLIVPISDELIVVINYPGSRSGLYKLIDRKGILLKEWKLDSVEIFDRPYDFLKCPNKNILVVQKNNEYGVNKNMYYFKFPKKVDRKKQNKIDKLYMVDHKNIKDCNSIYYESYHTKDNKNINSHNYNFHNANTKGLTNRPITLNNFSENRYLCNPHKHKVVCTDNKIYKRFLISLLKNKIK